MKIVYYRHVHTQSDKNLSKCPNSSYEEINRNCKKIGKRKIKNKKIKKQKVLKSGKS